MIAPYVVESPRIAGCDGLEVTRIDVRTYRPSNVTASERALSDTTAAGAFQHARTKPYIVRAYVLLKVGEPCTEQARRESERMLRAQAFVASAAVRAIPDGEGRVRIRVDVVDEMPWLASARLRGNNLSSLQLGTMNLRGRGLTAIVGAERGGVYRPGASVTIGQYGVFDRPAFAELELHRRPLGGLLRLAVTEPFLTDFQRRALHARFAQEVTYGRLVRAGDVDAASRVRRTDYSVGLLRRVGVTRRSRMLALGGLILMGTDIRSENHAVVVSDSGLVTVSDSLLEGRFPNYAVGRVAAMVGLRALRFKTVRRFESLRAEQDVGQGAELQILAGPRVGSTGESSDVLYAGNLYLGAGGESSFASFRMRAEGRRAPGQLGWAGFVGSAQLVWFSLPSETRTRTVTLSAARVDRVVFPVQLTFRDPQGGLIGFPDASEAGGRRAVMRYEERRLLPWVRTRAALAVGGFADMGRLWAGDVVYGRTSPVRGSVGMSVFAAFPSASKRYFRLDLALPLNPESRHTRFSMRLSSGDRTGTAWTEPGDVERARSAASSAAGSGFEKR